MGTKILGSAKSINAIHLKDGLEFSEFIRRQISKIRSNLSYHQSHALYCPKNG